ncbi:MAG: tetratricopeptide repeat protein [Acidobacteriaceae bacterium]|nr:tetratricopeptide repeat protein [Acidobacteriaceae bacterium]
MRKHLARILDSPLFNRSDRLRRFLQFSVSAALDGDSERLKEYVVGVEVFDRGPSFDPRIDPVVRVEARRLRARLQRWHDTEGRDSDIIIELPRGGYAAEFRLRDKQGHNAREQHAEKTIAVLPFTNLNADPELDYFMDGLTEELIHALTRLRGLHVVAWPSVSRLRGEDEDLAGIGEKLNVENILRGSVRRSGERLRMTAQLINVANRHYLWSEAWDRAAVDWLVIEQEIAQAIAEKLRVDGRLPRDTAPQRTTVDPETQTLYLKGRFQWNKRTLEGLRAAEAYFRKAADRDPDFPLAWAGLADTYAVMATFSMAPPAATMAAAKDAAERALALDASSSDAVTCLAFVRGEYDWEWQEAGELYRRAISLNPGYMTAHQWYGGDYLAVLGRFEEAIRELETAIRLDPLSSIVLNTRALVSMVAGDYEDAHRRYQDLVEHDPWFFMGWSALGRLYAQMSEYDLAIEMFQKARAMAGDFPKILGALGQTLGLAGRTHEARGVLRFLDRVSQTQYVGGTSFALVHLGLGEHDEALSRLERSVEQRELAIVWLKVHPAWDALRSEPRFNSILQRVGLCDSLP